MISDALATPGCQGPTHGSIIGHVNASTIRPPPRCSQQSPVLRFGIESAYNKRCFNTAPRLGDESGAGYLLVRVVDLHRSAVDPDFAYQVGTADSLWVVGRDPRPTSYDVGMNDDDLVCLCFRVSKRKIVNYCKREKPARVSLISECLSAGTGVWVVCSVYPKAVRPGPSRRRATRSTHLTRRIRATSLPIPHHGKTGRRCRLAIQKVCEKRRDFAVAH